MILLLLQQTIVGLIATIFLISSTKADFKNCNRTCGIGNQNRHHDDDDIPYPFGFSDGCPIQLNCFAGLVSIGKFQVQNFTGDSLLINLPAKCDRPIKDIEGLFGVNYALTWQNGLLLQNCTTEPKNCVIPIGLIERGLDSQPQGCDSGRDNISCYSVGQQGHDFMSFNNLNSTSCKVLYSSIAVDMRNNSNRNSVFSMEFQTVELGWWLDGGQCRCSSNANCTVVSLVDGSKGFRCRCKEGFEGDGFADGRGCWKVPHPVPKCDASTYMSGRCGGTTRVIVLVAGIIAGASLMSAVAVLCCYLRRRSTSFRSRMSAKRLFCEAAGSSSIPFFPYKEIEKSTNGFCEKHRLGTGAYGTVYAGKLHNDEWVAIKKLRYRDTDGIEQVMNEIKLLSSVSHPNLVRLLGCCIENGEQILVYEFMANGTLSQHLQRERGKGLPWTIRLTIATETAHAIAHLHNAMNPPIYHRDIKSSNILLDHQYNSKVADFGLSRLGMTDDSHISTAPQGTPGYLDPQYHQNFHLSDKSDVYSFGVVLVEIITALKVVDFSRPHSEVNLAALAIERIGKGCVDEIIDPFLEPNRDAWTLSSINKVAELAFRCLAFHRDMRPSMMEVADELEQIRISGWAPMDENICGGASSVSSYCSSSYNGVGSVGSRRLVVPQRAVECLTPMEVVQDCSPVSVHDPWLSAQSSPSTNSLLGKCS